jgi:hypothetical protein
MGEYVRAVTFEADNAAIDALVSEITSAEGPPEGLPATRLTVLADRAAGRLIVATRYASDEDRQKGAAILEGMSPPSDAGNINRVSVDNYEVLVERDS